MPSLEATHRATILWPVVPCEKEPDFVFYPGEGPGQFISRHHMWATVKLDQAATATGRPPQEILKRINEGEIISW